MDRSSRVQLNGRPSQLEGVRLRISPGDVSTYGGCDDELRRGGGVRSRVILQVIKCRDESRADVARGLNTFARMSRSVARFHHRRN